MSTHSKSYIDTAFDGLSFMHPGADAPGVHIPASFTGSHYLSSVDYINMSNRHLFIVNRDNLTVRLPAREQQYSTTNKVVMRQRYNFSDANVILFVMAEFEAMNRKGNLTDPILILIYKQLVDLQRSNPALRSASVVVDRVIELEQITRDESIYIASLDIVLVVDSIKRGFSHPFSSHGQAFMSYENFVREQVLSGAFIELVDNETRISRRFISMGRQILEIIPKKDPKRESGVYWSTAQHQGRDQIHVAPVFMTVEEAELQLGLCRTREEAEGAGDAAATFKAEMVKAQTALTEKEIELTRKKQEYSDKQHTNDTEIQALKHQINGQNLLIQQQKQDNEVLSARLEADKLYRNAHTNVIVNQEAIAAEARRQVLEEIEVERKAKEAKEKAEREDKSSKKKEKLEDKKASRENTSSLFKYIPAIITGVLAVGIGVAKVFGWW